ncbi:hypothetical protein HZB96_05155 [Candidatus Gottesmanbacteria bacterium]|nr:hypothetical protein [Candidatus Gottesmanbacteria bacterium]MBI5452033.1 hypothetical protein [Candidatus Gottesmanbacteria bacterium]
MKGKILLSILILVFSFVFSSAGSVLGAIKNPLPTITPTPTPTVEYVLPYPGILPDNPLYFLKVVRDRILLIFTRDSVKKIQLNLLFSDKRLVMGQLLWEKGKFELGIDTITKGEKYLLLSAVGIVELGKVGDPPPGLSDKVGLAAKKHIEIITKIISLTSDETYQKRLNDALGITHQAIQQIAPSS